MSDDLERDVKTRSASIKETGEELSSAEWARFDEAVAADKAARRTNGDDDPRLPAGRQLTSDEPTAARSTTAGR